MKSVLGEGDAAVVAMKRRIPSSVVRRWAAIIARYLSVQIVVQALNLVCGIMLVRVLSVHEYAFYTLANSMQATLILLADIGLTSALMATGGKVWQDRNRFGQLIQTGLHVRKTLALVGLCVVVPIVGWVFVSNGMSPLYAVVLCVVVLLGAGFRMTGDVLIIVPKLHGRIDRLQQVDLKGAAIRLVGTVIACASYVNAIVGVLVASLSLGYQNRMLRIWAREGADLSADTNDEDRRTIFEVVRRQAPNTIYYCVQGQIAVFLLSVFGSTTHIAEIGALSRLAVVFTLFGSVLTGILTPRFARSQEKSRMRNIYLGSIAVFGVIAGVLMIATLLAPGAILWVLGGKYAHLRKELVFMVVSSILYALVGVVYSLNAARAWLKGAWLSIPLTIVTQLCLIPLLDFHSVIGVVLFGCIPTIPCLVLYISMSYRGFRELRT